MPAAKERGTRIGLIERMRTDLFCLRQMRKWERGRGRPKPMAADDDEDWAD